MKSPLKDLYSGSLKQPTQTSALSPTYTGLTLQFGRQLTSTYGTGAGLSSSYEGLNLSGGGGTFGGAATNLIGSSGDAFTQTVSGGDGAAAAAKGGGGMSAAMMGGIAGGIGGILQGAIGRTKRRDAQKKAQGQYDDMLKQYQDLDTSNLYADVENQYTNMENTYEDLTVNQQQAQFEKDMFQQQQANVMQGLSGAAGGSGIAGLAQAMANQGQMAAQKASASIGMQESKINMLRAGEASKLQMQERTGEVQAMGARLAGAEKARSLDYQQTSTQLGMAQQDLAVKNQAIADADAALYGGVGQLVGVGAQLAMSDRKMKKNINLVGTSSSGLNIYNFEYINPKYGEGVFQGVMADEVPCNAVTHGNDYNMVDYSVIDVEFKRIN